MFSKIKLLDCTIRDGGYINNWEFNSEFGKSLIESIARSGCEYIEVGFFNPLDPNPVLYKNFNSNNIRDFINDKVKTVLLVNYTNELNLEVFPPQAELGASMLRFASHKTDRAAATELAARWLI
ncbi:MAG: hypothetical protein R3A13_04120 [Bdellovibrionota bacterium]